MKPKLPLGIRPLHFEQGIVSVFVSVILLVISWLIAHLYMQTTLGLKMAKNREQALKEQIKTENEVRNIIRGIQVKLIQDFKEDRNTYFLKYRQQHPNDLLGCIASDGTESNCVAEGKAICKRVIGGYQVTYSVPIVEVILTDASLNVQILSWSH